MTPNAYAELIDRLLLTCKYLEVPPHFKSEIEIPQVNPNAFKWCDTVQLQGGLRLKVTDYAIFDPSVGMAERLFMYDLREVATGRMVWRICNHGAWGSVESPCHVHCDPEDEGKRLEYWESSEETTFACVMGCIKKHYEGRKQDWENTV